jgi:hypothetical protein
MSSSINPAPDLLAVVREFLEAEILSDPGLADAKRFNVRVAINLLATAERELRLGPSANAAEADRLTALVGAEGSIEEKNRRLARSIREGVVACDDRQLLDHLHRTIVDALRINNPKWLDSSL